MSKVDGSTSAAKKRRLAKLEGSNPKTSNNTIEVKSIASPSLVSAAADAPPHPVYDALPRGLLAAEVLKVGGMSVCKASDKKIICQAEYSLCTPVSWVTIV